MGHFRTGASGEITTLLNRNINNSMSQPTIKIRPVKTSTELANIPNILQRVYLARGITDQQQLDYGLDKLPSPTLMKSNIQAARLLASAIGRQDRLLIVADFDVDGATSCTLMLLALRSMGATYVDYLVPDRFKFGYGLTPEIVDVAAELTPDLIITVDNGIASIDGVKRANQLGIDVLITDHHLPAKQLPDAIAIVNPNQAGCEFPTKALAGVGVAFYLLLALRMQLREQGWFSKNNIKEPNLSQYLDLVALGTVADIVPLEHCNRILVSQGIRRIRAGRCRPGIQALLALSGKELTHLQTSDLGFAVGPRLNAAGRLDDMSLGIECLLTESATKARELAEELDHLNKERKGIEATMQQQALDSLKKLNFDRQLNSGLCLYKAEWHQGIIGLLASRIKEKVFRPVIVFADADPDPKQPSKDSEAMLKGSGRSIPDLHIKDILDVVATKNPQLLNKFGGHAMAAGMTIKKSAFKAFSVAFNDSVVAALKGCQIDNIIWSDGELEHQEINLSAAKLIRDAGPWGQGFEEPRYHGEFKVVSQRVLSGKHLKLQLLNQSGRSFDAIAFFQEDQLLNTSLDKVTLVYKMDVNYFREQENLQLMIERIYPL